MGRLIAPKSDSKPLGLDLTLIGCIETLIGTRLEL